MQHKHKILAAFLASNIAIVLIPLVFFASSYFGLLREVRSDIATVTRQQVAQEQKLMESLLSSAYKQSVALSQQQDILNFAIKSDLTPLDMYNARSLCNALSSYKATNSSIYMICVYFSNSNTIVANDAIYTLDEFYPGFFTYGDMTPEMWRERCLNQYTTGEFLPLAPVAYRGYGFTGSIYRKTIGGARNNLATVLMVFDNESVAEAMRPLARQYAGWSYVQDTNGNLLASTEGMDTVDVFREYDVPLAAGVSQIGPYYVHTQGMFMRDWHLVSVMSLDHVFSRSNQLLISVSLLCLLVICIGFAVSFLLARSFAKPVHRAFSTIGDASVPALRRLNVYKGIEAGVLHLSHQNDALRSQVDEQLSALKTLFLNKLVAGNYKTMDEIRREAALAELEMSEEPYRVAIVRTPQSMGITAVPVDLTGMYQSLEALEIPMNSQNHVLLLRDCGSQLAVRERLAPLLEAAREAISADVIIAVGNAYLLGLEISRSCEEAMETISFQEATAERGIWFYADMPVQRDFFHYPAKAEADLTRYVRAGNMEIVESILEEIIQENTRNRILSLQMKRQLISELCGTAIRLAEQVIQPDSPESAAFHTMVRQAAETDDLVVVQSLLHALLDQICDQYRGRMKSHNTGLISDILAYLGREYTNYSLGLQMVADVFKMNETYLSTFFKEQTGKNFAAYVETLRIERAAVLLCESVTPIEEIAEAVGYASQHTFRRAFKKLMHASPSDYRKQYQQVHKGE